MRYTLLGRTGPSVSRLGFGCMRLPMTAEGRVDRALATPLLRRAVDLGVTYFDTAIFYCNGDSQRALGEALHGLRERVVLSTKNHLHDAPADVWWRQLEDSLTFLQTDAIDCYHCHGITWAVFQQHLAGPDGKLKLMERARAQGKVRHLCCSFHDTPEALLKIIETGAFEVITLQYNLLNRSLEPALDRALERGIGIVVMGPVGGGRLGVRSERIRELTGQAAESTPEAALRFVLAHPAVSVALSGMSTLAMLEDNVRSVADKEPFTAAQIRALEAETHRVKALLGVPCTACGYCQPCPFGVDIPGNFAVYNEYKLYGLTDQARATYGHLADPAAVCAECGVCQPRCPQRIAIPDALRRVMAELDADWRDFGSLLSLRAARGDCLDVRLTTRNVRPEPIRPHVHIELEDGCVVQPAAVDFPEVPPYASTTGTLAVRVPDGVGALRGRCVTLHEEACRETRVFRPFFIIPRDAWRRHRACLTAADWGGNETVAAAHGYTVALMHDGRTLYARVEVRSALHALAPLGATTGGRLEWYLDLRPPEHRARDVYEEGVEQFLVSFAAARYRTQSGRSYALDLALERTADGCRLTLALPFAALMRPEWPLPATLGMDWMLVAAAPDGAEYGHPTYGGRQGLWQHPRWFTPAYVM